MNQNRPDNERTTHTTRIVTLDFNGGSHIYRNPELGMNIPVRIAPSGISAERARFIAEALNRNCADSNVRFELGVSSTESKSSVRIGRTADFDRYGAFLGLAEGIGSGDAFVLLDDSANDAELVDVIWHEAGHILGTLDHGGEGLARYAWEHIEDDYFFASESNLYLKRVTTKIITCTFLSAPATADEITLYDTSNGTETLNEYSSYNYEDGIPPTEYVNVAIDSECYRTADGSAANTIRVYGGSARNCTADLISVTNNSERDIYSKDFARYVGQRDYISYSNYTFFPGTVINCTVNDRLHVDGGGTASGCIASNIRVEGRRILTDLAEYFNPTEVVSETFQSFNGTAVNCTVNGGILEVFYGGIAKDIIVRSGNASIGYTYRYHSPYETAVEQCDQCGYAQAFNLNVEGGSVSVGYGGELHNATIDGKLEVTQGALLSGVITCKSMDISGVVPGTNITVKLDLNDYAIPNHSEFIFDDQGRTVKKIDYFANYTTRTTTMTSIYDLETDGYKDVEIVTCDTFDKDDVDFDMSDWKYVFEVDIGQVDEMALPYILLDFGGTEKDFDAGSIHFSYPSSVQHLPFQMKSNKDKWKEERIANYGWTDSDGIFHEETDYYYGWISYDATLLGEASEVLWLENGWDDETEYTVVLPDDVMKGATEELTVTEKGSGNNSAMSEAELKGGKLVFKGGVDSGTYTVKAEEKNGVDHTCELDLWVIPEEIPIVGKRGAKFIAEMLKEMRSSGQKTFTKALPHNIHTSICGMPFDLNNVGVTLSADFSEQSFLAKLQGKIAWKLNKDTAGTGKQLNLVIDLSGANYITIRNKLGTYDWEMVGEFKVPDFKIGGFEFSGMSLNVNTVQSAFSAAGFVKLPWIKYAFGGDIGIVGGYLDSMSIGVGGINKPLGGTPLFVQSVKGGISGIATSTSLSFNGTIGLTGGPVVKIEFADWLGLASGDYSLCEITITGTLSTSGDFYGTANTSVLGGFITGGKSAGIKNGELFITGTFGVMNNCITIEGELRAGFSGGITLTGKGAMSVPREKIFGPLAGLTLAVNTRTNLNVQNPGASYVKAWSDISIFGKTMTGGFQYSFDKGLSLIGFNDKQSNGDTPKRSLRALDTVSTRGSSVKGISVAAPLRGESTPSASEQYTVTDPGLTFFQVYFSVSDASMSLAYGGTEYTQADIAAGTFANMQIVGELSSPDGETGTSWITVAVDNAASGEWTINAYGDADATFEAYTLLSGAPAPVLTAVELGEDRRSATIRYTADFSDLTNATISVYRADGAAADVTGGSKVAEIAAAEATGVYEYALPDEVDGGSYSFYLMVESDDHAPVYSGISEAYTFRASDTEAPDQVQVIDCEWKSSGTVVTWEAPWDDQGVAGYKVRYATGDEDMAEAEVQTNTFTFDKVPNGIYDFQIAAYDEAGNLSAWSEQQSCLVLTVANAKHKDMTLTEDLELAEFESAVGITAGDFAVTAAANSLVSGSALGDAGISGIVENTSINGAANLYNGAEAYNLTVNEKLTVGRAVPDNGDATLIAALQEFPDDFEDLEAEGREGGDAGNGDGTGGETDGEETEVPSEGQKAVVEIKKSAFANGVTVSDGGKLTVESGSQAQNIMVETGGTLALKAGAEYSGLSLDYGSSLIIVNNDTGSSSGKYLLTDSFKTAGTITTRLYLDANGNKIRFEQYKQTSEYTKVDLDVDFVYDNIAFLPDMDRLIGDALEMEIDSTVRGKFKIADAAKYFNGTITVVDHASGDSAVVGFDEYTLVGHGICRLEKSDDNGLYLETYHSEIDAPTLTVEYADDSSYDYIDLTGLEADDSGVITDCTFRYSLNEDMSDAVTVSTTNLYQKIQLSKDGFLDNATYYVQVSVKNEYGVTSPWSDVVSFTVTPKLYPAAPPPVTVKDATNAYATEIYFKIEGVVENELPIRGFRFRYADNPEMENAETITNNASYQSYLYLDKSEITDGVDYYIQASVLYGSDWSYWSDAVVFNTQGWDYDGITIGPEPDGDFNEFTLYGKSAKNVKVISEGYFFGGGKIDGLIIEEGGYFRDDSAAVTNAVVNGGRYWLDTGNVTDLVVKSGELRLMNGTLKGTTIIGADAVMDLDLSSKTPNLNGTILIQGKFSIYSMHPVFSTDAEFILDVGAHEANKNTAFIDFISLLSGNSKFTVKLDDTPEIGDYQVCSLYGVAETGLPISLVANNGTIISDLKVGESPVLFNGLYYSLVDYNDVAYLHISDNTDPVFLGKIKLAKNGTFYASDFTYSDLTVSSSGDCDYVFVGEGGQISSFTVGDGGSVDVYGDVLGMTVGNGGLLTMKEGSVAQMSDIIIQQGGTVVIEGGSVTTETTFNVAGTLTVNGILNSYEEDNQWGSFSHRFAFRLDQLDAPTENIMISNYANLQCNAALSVYASANQKNGTYKLMGGAAAFSDSIALHVDGHGMTEYLALGAKQKIGNTYYLLRRDNDVLTLTVGSDSGGGTETDKPEPRPDDGTENGSVFDNDGNVKENFAESAGTAIKEGAGPVQIDETALGQTVDGTVYDNFVGYGDPIDYAKISLEKAANLSFFLDASGAVKFTFYKLNEKTGKKTSLKSLQSTTLKKGGNDKSTKQILVEAGDYYISMQSTNAKKKDAAAFYNVRLNETGDKPSCFYADGDNGDNKYLYDKKQKNVWNSNVLDADALVIDDSFLEEGKRAIQIDTDAETVVNHDGFTNFVGFGDAMDFRKIELKSAAKLSFDLAKTTGGAAKLVVYTVNDSGKMVVASSKLTVSVKATAPSGSVKNQVVLRKGVYYIAVQSTDAKKGKEAYYNVSLNANSVFYEHGDSNLNDFISKTKKVDEEVMKEENAVALIQGNPLQIDGAIDGDAPVEYKDAGDNVYTNFVGTGDESDVVRIQANDGMKVSLKVTATDAVSLVIYGLQKNGTLKALKTVKSKNNVASLNDFELKAKSAPGGQFFLGVTSTNAKKGSAAYYNVDVVDVSGQNPPLSSSEASSLAMPETDSLGISDAMNFGGYDTDVLADASASALANLDDKIGWLNIASLA